MHPRKPSLTGTGTPHTARPAAPEFTFRADLLKPRQSQISQYADDVTNRITQLDLHARQLGEGFGIPFNGFVLNPVPDADPANGASVARALLHALAIREERVSLERRSGQWGLYFTRGISLLSQDRASETIPLRDAPLDVRERFLVKSRDFFAQYLKLSEDRLGKMRQSVLAADETLRQLGTVRLT